ncbi:ATP-binding protein [Herbiconiux sp. L3-i23]|uniref:AAA family ATPase n=1 Tax=Herbiconiux sp. L3-i23 TaxID=2905871 RepID=UPI002074A04B|nr:ATP-binding protein [Herbiconiux sp. L3-i23]
MTPATVGGRVPYIVLVVGRPASGKSTISAAVAERFNLPLLSKDALKELLFDHLGSGDRARSIELGRTAFALLDHLIHLQLQSGAPFLVDAAYDAQIENEKFRAWQQEFGFIAVQVHCTAPIDELMRRFIVRAQDGTRHSGHADHDSIDEYRRSLSDDRHETLDLDGPIVKYDFTVTTTADLLEELVAVMGTHP